MCEVTNWHSDLCPPVPRCTQPSHLPKSENLQPSWASFSYTHIQKPPSPDSSLGKAPWFSSSQPPKWDLSACQWLFKTTVHVVLPSSICLPQASKSSSLNYRSELVTCLQNVCQRLRVTQEKGQDLQGSWPVFVFSYLSGPFQLSAKPLSAPSRAPSLFLLGFSRAF